MPQAVCALCNKRLKIHQRRPVNEHIKKYLRKFHLLECNDTEYICGKCSRPAYQNHDHEQVSSSHRGPSPKPTQQTVCVLCNKRLKIHQRRPVNEHIKKYLQKFYQLESSGIEYICGKCSRPAYQNHDHEQGSTSHRGPSPKPTQQSSTESVIPLSQMQSPPSVRQNIKSATKSHDYCFICKQPGPELIVVSQNLRTDVFLKHNIIITSDSRCCSSHLDGNLNFNPEVLQGLKTDDYSYLNRSSIIELSSNRLSFDNLNDYTDCGRTNMTELNKDQLPDLYNYNSTMSAPARPSKKKGFKIKSSIDLDALITSAINSLSSTVISEEPAKFDEELQKLQAQLKLVEKKQKEIKSIFSSCDKELEKCKDNLEAADKGEEEELRLAKEAFLEAPKQPSEITIVDSDGPGDEEDDDDDDVQFIEKTFDPEIAIKRQGQQIMNRSPARSPARSHEPGSQSNSQSLTNKSQSRASLAAALSAAGNQSAQFKSQGLSSPSTVASARAAFAAMVNQKYGQSNTSVSQTIPQPIPSAPPFNALTRSSSSSGQPYPNSMANQERMEKAFLEDVLKVKAGAIVLGNRYNDVWDKAKILDIQNNSSVEERKYKLKFDGMKVTRTMTSRQTAFFESINKPVTVGTRIVALYKDDETDESFYAGIVAEAPNSRNELRYLVFFDDGYAQYCSSKEIHKVFYQSKAVWEDIHPDSQDFVKDYLAQYPERPMVRLHKGQTVKTEWKGRWWTARVDEVDASLVQMYFAADKRSEWIYRGSTRLEPLYTALANAEANRNAGKGKRHNLNMAMGRKPVVEYTRKDSQETISPSKLADRKKSVAKKSTTPRSSTEEKPASTLNTGQIWEAPWLKNRKQVDKKPLKALEKPAGVGRGKAAKDMASVLQERLSVTDDGNLDGESYGSRLPQKIEQIKLERKRITPHKCGKKCVPNDGPEKYRGKNPLLIPIYCGWERHICKHKPYGRRSVIYRAPCGRRLRNMNELRKFLWSTNSELPIDLFNYDSELHVHYEFIPVKTFCDIKDISYGKENVVISCVNGIDRQYPDYVDYSNQRIPAAGVKLNVDPEFLVCCDCTDGCQDKWSCACQQLTIESSAVINGGKPDPFIGYQNRRLMDVTLSGIYECNSRCKCDKRCMNRVVQNGLQNRLQVFKTEKCGWGLRCLDDIPKGGFICIYAGQLLTDQGANEDGQQYGDEYLAELDYIEVVEKQKEGYESDVEDIDDMEEEEEDEEGGKLSSDSDASFSGNIKPVEVTEKEHRTRRKTKIDSVSQDSDDSAAVSKKSSTNTSKRGRGRGRKSVRETHSNSSSNSKRANDVKSPSEFSLPDLDRGSETDKTEKAEEATDEKETGLKKRRTGRSTGGRYGSVNPSKIPKEKESQEKDSSFTGPSTRDFYSDDQSCYIMDAKSMGNIGRYLNHSCTPCAFVQNVFVDTHDLRFPWVAFFAGTYISAGTELTWDYNYEVGSVPGKVLYCYCGSADCRGRLL